MLGGCRSCVLGVAAVVCLATRAVLSENQGCGDIPTEANLRIEDLEGEWFPMEVVLHRNDSKINGVPLNTKCPVVIFTLPPRTKKIITMTWNSTEGYLEYKFTQKGSRAQWQSTSNQSGMRFYILDMDVNKHLLLQLCSPTAHVTYLLTKEMVRSQSAVDQANNQLEQLVKTDGSVRSPLCSNGTLASQLSYKPFNGSMKIMKHEDKFLILHFCSKRQFPLSLLFLSRDQKMPPDFIRSTLEEMDNLGYKKSKEMPIGPCKVNDDGGGVRASSIWLLSLLPCLGIVLPNH